MFKTILVPLDGSPLAEHALPVAERLARLGDAELVLVRCANAHAPTEEGLIEAQVQAVQEAEQYLVSVTHKLAEAGLTTAISTPFGDTVQELLMQVRAHHADLVVMATHGRSGPGRWLYGSVADAVLRAAPVPVLLVPTAPAPEWLTTGQPRILVSLDGSELAEEILETVIDLAQHLGAEVLLLRVVEFPPYGPVADEADFSIYDVEAERTYAEEYIARTADRLRARGLTVRGFTTLGRPTWAIADLAGQEHADLVAMATHGRGGLARLVLGSVATGTLQHARVPLLLVRPMALRTTTDAAQFEESTAGTMLTPAGAGVDAETGEAAGMAGVVGAAIGAASGGPIGAAIGAAGGMLAGAAAELALHPLLHSASPEVPAAGHVDTDDDSGASGV